MAKFKVWAYEKWGRFDLESGTGMLLIRKVGTTMTSVETGWPDQDIFIRRGPGRFDLMMLEWKRSNKHRCTEAQLRRHAELRAMGVDVHVVSDVPAAKDLLQRKIGGAP